MRCLRGGWEAEPHEILPAVTESRRLPAMCCGIAALSLSHGPLTSRECTHIFRERTHEYWMVAKKKLKANLKPASRKAKPRPAKSRPAGRRAQNKQAMREGIVKAALSLFQTKGFDATTTKAIARKA